MAGRESSEEEEFFDCYGEGEGEEELRSSVIRYDDSGIKERQGESAYEESFHCCLAGSSPPTLTVTLSSPLQRGKEERGERVGGREALSESGDRERARESERGRVCVEEEEERESEEERRARLALHFSGLTLAKADSCRKFFEHHYSDLFAWRKSRADRRLRLEQEMEQMHLHEKVRAKKRDRLCHLETKYTRERRMRVTVHHFETVRVIGRGGFGEVRLVRMRNREQVFAMKVMRKSRLIKRKQEDHVNSERNALAFVTDLYKRNPWVIKLYYSFQDSQFLYLVMEFMPGGDLMHKLIELDVFTIEQTRFYIAELVLAIESIHSLGCIHRDIKPDNILLDSRGHICLTDFGLCTGLVARRGYTDSDTDRIFNDSEDGKGVASSSGDSLRPFHDSSARFNSWKKKRKFLLFSAVGTPDYIAPEVLSKQGYGKECDWWSVGVIMFEMLAGGPPFYAETPYKTRKNVVNFWQILATGWQKQELDKFDRDARDLILRFLCAANERIGRNSVDEIKRHPFFEGIDWDNLRETEAPIIPTVQGDCDTSNFPSDEIMEEPENDDSDSDMAGSLDPLEPDQERDNQLRRDRFMGFSYRSFMALQEEFGSI